MAAKRKGTNCTARRAGHTGHAGTNGFAKKPGICIIPGCTRPVKSRGLCEPCYQTAARVVRYGSTTWDDLVAIGLARDGLTRGPNRFLVAFNQKTSRKPMRPKHSK